MYASCDVVRAPAIGECGGQPGGAEHLGHERHRIGVDLGGARWSRWNAVAQCGVQRADCGVAVLQAHLVGTPGARTGRPCAPALYSGVYQSALRSSLIIFSEMNRHVDVVVAQLLHFA